MKKKICFRADASGQIGLGHFVRSLALADMLKNDFDCIFYTAEPSDYQIRELRKVCPFISLSEKTKFEDFLSCLDGSEIVVLDNYYYTTEYQKQIKEKGCKLVCIDDMHDKHYVADIVINHAYGCHKEDYSVEPYTQLSLGLNYALLRKPFLDINAKPNHSQKRVLICYGGLDVHNLTCKTILSLGDVIEKYQVEVIVGAAFSAKEELAKHASKNTNIHIHTALNAEEMSALMRESQVAFLSASSVLWEAIFSGCKIIYGYYVDNQLDICRNVGNNLSLGLSYVGDLREVTSDNLKTAFLKAVDSDALAGFKKPDVRSHYLALFNSSVTIREATIDDAKLFFEWANDPVVRQMAFHTEPIPWENHIKWFNTKVKSPKSHLLLCYHGLEPIGQVRFDILDGDEAEIDISIDKDQRGKGYGRAMLNAAIEYEYLMNNVSSFISEVKHENLSSNKLFLTCGFHLQKSYNNTNYYSLIK